MKPPVHVDKKPPAPPPVPVQAAPVDPAPAPVAPYRERYIHPERPVQTPMASARPVKPFVAASPVVGHGGEKAQRAVRKKAKVSSRVRAGR